MVITAADHLERHLVVIANPFQRRFNDDRLESIVRYADDGARRASEISENMRMRVHANRSLCIIRVSRIHHG